MTVHLAEAVLFNLNCKMKRRAVCCASTPGLTEVMVSAEATMSARPALMMCSSRSFSMGSMPLGTLSIRENIRCSSGRKEATVMLKKNKTGWVDKVAKCAATFIWGHFEVWGHTGTRRKVDNHKCHLDKDLRGNCFLPVTSFTRLWTTAVLIFLLEHSFWV